jgi:hypothetical protein
MASELLIPRRQLFYADADKNPQEKTITPFIDFGILGLSEGNIRLGHAMTYFL